MKKLFIKCMYSFGRSAWGRMAIYITVTWLTVGFSLVSFGWEGGLLQAPAGTPPSAKPTKIKAIIPFEMLPTNHMLVEARINGKGPYRLIFDLGAPITLLNNRVSEAAGVIKAGAPRSLLFGMRGEVEVDKLQVGDLTVTKLPVIVFDHPLLSALEEMTDRRIDGLMGFTFFARYKTTIDYHARQMTFEPINYQVRDLLKELPDRLLGPKVARERVLVPAGIYGMRLGKAVGGLDSPGVLIAAVLADSPAERAGLRAGDVLVALDGRWTASVADVFHAAAAAEPGRETTVVISRDGKEQPLTIRPAFGA
jgi:membrane-associated protease RseP (regulator of RpoE activity)